MVFLLEVAGIRVPSIRTSGHSKGFHTFCRSLGILERHDLGTGEYETPIHGRFTRDCRSKTVPSIRISGIIKTLEGFQITRESTKTWSWNLWNHSTYLWQFSERSTSKTMLSIRTSAYYKNFYSYSRWLSILESLQKIARNKRNEEYWHLFHRMPCCVFFDWEDKSDINRWPLHQLKIICMMISINWTSFITTWKNQGHILDNILFSLIWEAYINYNIPKVYQQRDSSENERGCRGENRVYFSW